MYFFFFPLTLCILSYLQFNCKALKFDSLEMRKRKFDEEKRISTTTAMRCLQFFPLLHPISSFFISYLTDFFTPLAFTLNLFIFYRLYRHSFFFWTQREIQFFAFVVCCFIFLCVTCIHMLLTYKFWMYENVIIFWWNFMNCNLYSFRLWKCKRLYFVNKVEEFHVLKSWAPYIMNYIDFKMLIRLQSVTLTINS